METARTGSRKMLSPERQFECGICNARLMQLCYQRSRSFRLFRKALVGAMSVLGRLHSIDGRLNNFTESECRECVRHLKGRLKQRSLAFRLLNKCVNPIFHFFRGRLVTPAELDEARRFAREACRRRLAGEPGQSAEGATRATENPPEKQIFILSRRFGTPYEVRTTQELGTSPPELQEDLPDEYQWP